VRDYRAHVVCLKTAIEKVVDTYFDAPVNHFRAIEDAIGERWKAAVADEDQAKRARAVIAASPYQPPSYLMANIMWCAPSLAYASAFTQPLWDDSHAIPGTLKCARFRVASNAASNENFKAQYPVFTKVSVVHVIGLVDHYMKQTYLVPNHHADVGDSTEREYGQVPIGVDAKVVADTVPLQFQNGHSMKDWTAWSSRRYLYRCFAYEEFIGQLTPILKRAATDKEIEVVYTDEGKCLPKHVSLSKMLDVLVRSTKSNACLLRIYITEDHGQTI
jgi:hypothetical protein